ncbi:MAG: hypothetical protein CMP11_07240 [Zetaproteobacteria bacterium]|nr:hypothetical protein [Pseudobdellovibrionaceae bacterium]|tara:strand:+ start:737 stop:1150 length:414 start_codon:yes stop_codon:yes gene_type:complete
MIHFPRFSIPEKELELKFVRSSGAGGQHINKVSTKVELKWSVLFSTALPETIKKRFIKSFAHRINSKGQITLTCDKNRNRLRNIDEVLTRLKIMIESVQEEPRKRIKKKPTRSSIEKRLKEKKMRSNLKKSRRIKFD